MSDCPTLLQTDLRKQHVGPWKIPCVIHQTWSSSDAEVLGCINPGTTNTQKTSKKHFSVQRDSPQICVKGVASPISHGRNGTPGNNKIVGKHKGWVKTWLQMNPSCEHRLWNDTQLAELARTKSPEAWQMAFVTGTAWCFWDFSSCRSW